MELTDSQKAILSQVVYAFAEAEAVTQDEADHSIAKVLGGKFSFLVWDALGCDDQGIVKSTPWLKKLYKAQANLYAAESANRKQSRKLVS